MIRAENFMSQRNEKKKKNLKSGLKRKKTLAKLLEKLRAPILTLKRILESDREADQDPR